MTKTGNAKAKASSSSLDVNYNRAEAASYECDQCRRVKMPGRNGSARDKPCYLTCSHIREDHEAGPGYHGCGEDAESYETDVNETFSDEDEALGEVTDDDDDDDEDGGAICNTRQTSPRTPDRRSSVNVFDYLESEDPLVYHEKRNDSRPISPEKRTKPASLYETKRCG
ncbi:hypothetical protein PG999_005914 [Apiospora kogelbergensis]|uniref:Uncharacterized protein n=1 Tax=Apiospora kogelbergensis TaxID=1337665 RepID=A0AAW0QP83_9PEZI